MQGFLANLFQTRTDDKEEDLNLESNIFVIKSSWSIFYQPLIVLAQTLRSWNIFV